METPDRQPTASGPDQSATILGRAAAAIGVIIVLVAGVFVWGRLAATETVAMVLTGAWFLAVLVGAAVLARRRRQLAVPLAVGYGLTAIAATILLGLPQLRDTTVDEQVASVDAPVAAAIPSETGEPSMTTPTAPTSEPPAAESEAPAETEEPNEPGPRRNTALATGMFVDLAHPGTGTATIVDLADGGRVLTLTEFRTDSGPDLRVYLTARDPAADGEIGRFVDLGRLKGNVGDQQYEIPDDVDVDEFSNAVIWCRAFSVGFTSAALNAG